MEWWCNNCGGLGEVPTTDLNLDEAICVVCSHCSHPIVYAWCEKCGAGIEREEIDLANQPKTWTCQMCGTEYPFPSLFYQHPIYFQPNEFSELVHIENEIDFRKYEHVNIIWLRKMFLFWDKYRPTTLVISVILFALAILVLFFSKETKPLLIAGWSALVLVAFYFLSILADIIFWVVSKIFLLIYRIRKKQE
jgi:hypothetical protein